MTSGTTQKTHAARVAPNPSQQFRSLPALRAHPQYLFLYLFLFYNFALASEIKCEQNFLKIIEN